MPCIVNKSVPTLVQASVVGGNGCIGSRWCFRLNSRQVLHREIISVISEDMPGQYKASRARALHLSMPRCPSCIRLFISLLIDVGTMMRLPLSMMPSASEISSWWVRYGLTASGIVFLSLGYPSRMNNFSFCRFSYCAVSLLSSLEFLSWNGRGIEFLVLELLVWLDDWDMLCWVCRLQESHFLG